MSDGANQPTAPDAATRARWFAEFEAIPKLSMEERFKRGFVKSYRPVLDDARYRSFETLEEYRRWCEATYHDPWDSIATRRGQSLLGTRWVLMPTR